MPEQLKSIQIPRNWKREKRIGNKYEECTLCDFFTRCDYKASNSTLNPKKVKRKGKKKKTAIHHVKLRMYKWETLTPTGEIHR